MQDGEGWIKLYWKTKDSLAWSTGPSAALWVHILLSTARRQQLLRSGQVLMPGQCLISQAQLAPWLGVSRRTVASILATFEREGMITTQQSSRSGTVLSVCNWETYQRRKPDARTAKSPKAHSKRTESAQKAHSKRAQTESPKSKEVREKKGAASPLAAVEPAELAEAGRRWVDYRTARKPALTGRSREALPSRLATLRDRHGAEAVIDAIDRAIAAGWQGFEHGLQGPSQPASRGSPSPPKSRGEIATERFLAAYGGSHGDSGNSGIRGQHALRLQGPATGQ